MGKAKEKTTTLASYLFQKSDHLPTPFPTEAKSKCYRALF